MLEEQCHGILVIMDGCMKQKCSLINYKTSGRKPYPSSALLMQEEKKSKLYDEFQIKM